MSYIGYIMQPCDNHYALRLVVIVVVSFSESAKGSDSEDDFIRQRTKPKAASDSDSDSDVGTNQRKEWPCWFITGPTSGLHYVQCSSNLSPQRRRPQQTTCLERLTTSPQTVMQRSL